MLIIIDIDIDKRLRVEAPNFAPSKIKELLGKSSTPLSEKKRSLSDPRRGGKFNGVEKTYSAPLKRLDPTRADVLLQLDLHVDTHKQHKKAFKYEDVKEITVPVFQWSRRNDPLNEKGLRFKSFGSGAFRKRIADKSQMFT